MDLSSFIVALFCLIDDRLKGRRVRQRGPSPKLSDAEAITIELVGEFLGLDTDEAIFRYFREHYGRVVPRSARSSPHHLRQAGGQPLEDQGEHLASSPLSDSS